MFALFCSNYICAKQEAVLKKSVRLRKMNFNEKAFVSVSNVHDCRIVRL